MISGYDTIVFDLDGTITKDVSTWETVHKAFGVNEEALKYRKRIENRFNKDVKVNAIDWAKNDIELWRGRNYNDVINAVTPISFYDNAIMSIRKLSQDFNIFILSGTFDAYLDSVVREIGRDYITDWNCHVIKVDDDNIITGVEEDPAMVDKSLGIRVLEATHGFYLDRTIAIGNGSNDIAMFREAGLAIAFNPYNKRVKSEVKCSIISEDFYDIVRYLKGW